MWAPRQNLGPLPKAKLLVSYMKKSKTPLNSKELRVYGTTLPNISHSHLESAGVATTSKTLSSLAFLFCQAFHSDLIEATKKSKKKATT